MMNKKLIALLMVISTISMSTFALFDRVLQGTSDIATDVVSLPEDAVTRGESWKKRQAYREDRNEVRRQQERKDDMKKNTNCKRCKMETTDNE